MNRALAIEFSRVTEAAALAAYTWLGRGNKNAADEAAVKAMRYMLNLIHMDGEIVIGEGEIDEAPMLYIGEKVGSGNGELVSIAVDPIDGTRMTAMGQSNAISVLAAGGKRTFLKAPDMYMEKLVVGPEVKGMIDLSLPIEQNLRRVASRLGKSLSDLTVMVLAKPRHDEVIKQMHNLGIRVMAIPDGDVAVAGAGVILKLVAVEILPDGVHQNVRVGGGNFAGAVVKNGLFGVGLFLGQGYDVAAQNDVRRLHGDADTQCFQGRSS